MLTYVDADLLTGAYPPLVRRKRPLIGIARWADASRSMITSA
jgi:hypothetical protein